MNKPTNYTAATPRDLVLMSDININSLRAIDYRLYMPPTPSDVKELRKLCGLTQIGLAKLVGVSYTKNGSSTVAKWETSETKPEHRRIPYSAWRLLLVTLNIVEVEPYKAG